MNNNVKRETLKSEWSIPKHVNKTLIEPQSINLSFAKTGTCTRERNFSTHAIQRF